MLFGYRSVIVNEALYTPQFAVKEMEQQPHCLVPREWRMTERPAKAGAWTSFDIPKCIYLHFHYVYANLIWVLFVVSWTIGNQ